jgi:type IV secretion system protein VirB4
MTRRTRPPGEPKRDRNFERRERTAAQMLPFARHFDDSTLMARDGALIQALHIQGFPFETADTEELNYRKAVRDTMVRALAGPRLAIYHHVVRRETVPHAEGVFRNPFAKGLDLAWRRRLTGQRLFVNDLFLTLVRKPLVAKGDFLDLFMSRRPEEDAADRARDRRELGGARDALLAALAPYGARPLSAYVGADGPCSELLELFGCIYNGVMAPIPYTTGDASRAFTRRRVSFGAEALELGPMGEEPKQFIAMLSVKDYPLHTAPGQMDALLRLPHSFTLTESFAFVDRQAALDRMNLALRRMRAADDEAISLRQDLAAAKDNVAAGRAVFGEHHLTLAVAADSLPQLDSAVADVKSTLNEIGMIGVREEAAMEPAFWAQFPGNFAYMPRRALISSANFAGFASLHNHPRGRAQDNHWGPAVTVLETTAASPYYFNFHKGDLGNFIVIGPSGSGKTVVVNFLLAQAQKFNPRLIFFDKDRGAEIFLRALGGRYELLRPGVVTGFNPLQLPDNPVNRRFLQQWVAKLLCAHGETLTADDSAVIADAVSANFEQAPQYRRLRYFRELFVGQRRPAMGDLAARLAPWVGEGDKAWLFDNEVDQLDLTARVVGFDMTQLLDDPVTRTPAMMYLFHRVEERLDGDPSVIVIDEGWKALDDDVFVARIRDWEKTIRKRNGIVGFVTQSASDALESRVASAIVEQSATQIFLPNAKAQERDYREGFGLSRHEFDLIRTLPDTSRCFLIRHGADSVVARLNLNGFEELLTVLSGRERTVRRLDDLRAQLGDDPAMWLPQLVREGR